MTTPRNCVFWFDFFLERNCACSSLKSRTCWLPWGVTAALCGHVSHTVKNWIPVTLTFCQLSWTWWLSCSVAAAWGVGAGRGVGGGRLQLNGRIYTPYVCGLYRDGSSRFVVAPPWQWAMSRNNRGQLTEYTTSVDIQKRTIKGYSHWFSIKLFQSLQPVRGNKST